MTASITPAPDGSYVDVFVPISFKRFGGRKTIVAPDGRQLTPNRSKATDRTLIKALSPRLSLAEAARRRPTSRGRSGSRFLHRTSSRPS